MLAFSTSEQGSSVGSSIIVAAVFTGIVFLVLRSAASALRLAHAATGLLDAPVGGGADARIARAMTPSQRRFIGSRSLFVGRWSTPKRRSVHILMRPLLS